MKYIGIKFSNLSARGEKEFLTGGVSLSLDKSCSDTCATAKIPLYGSSHDKDLLSTSPFLQSTFVSS